MLDCKEKMYKVNAAFSIRSPTDKKFYVGLRRENASGQCCIFSWPERRWPERHWPECPGPINYLAV
jgi:hypothetical protein